MALHDSRTQSTKATRKVVSGSTRLYPKIDAGLDNWVMKQKKFGLVVKDKYITAKSAEISD